MAEEPLEDQTSRRGGHDDLGQRLEERYIQSLLAHGEAVMEGDPVPDRATYVVSRSEDGRLTARRQQFSVSGSGDACPPAS